MAKRNRRGATPSHQRGAALLLVVFLLVAGVAGFYLRGPVANTPQRERAESVTRAMAAAKTALIAYAVHYGHDYRAGGPGHLPCPDTNNNGSPNPPCPVGAIGRLPASLTTPAPADGSGRTMRFSDYGMDRDRRLWYAVSDEFRNNRTESPANAGVVNSNTRGHLTVDGVSGAVAVLIDPGAPLAGQHRPSADVADYLESENADGDTVFATVGNDRLLAIRSSEVMPATVRSATGTIQAELTALLRRYAAECGVYPDAVPYQNPVLVGGFDSHPGTGEGLFPFESATPYDWGGPCPTGVAPTLTLTGWIVDNGWLRHVYYARAPGGPGCSPGVDCLTLNGDSDGEAVLVFPGVALAGQDRGAASAGLADYFESRNASEGDGDYQTGTWSGAFNDQAFVVN